jgi:hypothetical protein
MVSDCSKEILWIVALGGVLPPRTPLRRGRQAMTIILKVSGGQIDHFTVVYLVSIDRGSDNSYDILKIPFLGLGCAL